MSNNPQPQFDKWGQCPNCEKGWDGGDIFEVLQTLDVFRGKSKQEILNIAAVNYGYTEANKTRFTRLVSIEPISTSVKPRFFWQCPHCGHVWDKFTSEHFNSLTDAIGMAPVVTLPEDPLAWTEQ